jgi:hypothetical protein
MAFTYTLLGEGADVTCQTLDPHWPAPTELLAELVLTGPDVGYVVHRRARLDCDQPRSKTRLASGRPETSG